MTHHLNLNPFNNHRRSVHKALSTPCFLLLPLPWRSSDEMVPPSCISLPCTKAGARTLCCRSVIILPGSQKVTVTTMNWSGTHQSHRHSSNHGRLLGKTHITRVALLCPQPHKKAADDGGASVFRLSGSCAGKLQSSYDSIFVQENDCC